MGKKKAASAANTNGTQRSQRRLFQSQRAQDEAQFKIESMLLSNDVRTIDVQPGYVIVDTSTANGGIHYARGRTTEQEINNGQGLMSVHKTTKTVDHREAVAAADALVKSADYICRRYCTPALFGWFLPEDRLEAFAEEFATLAEQAVQVNTAAKRLGSGRRVYIGFVPAKLDLATEQAAREVARTVYDVLTRVHAALRHGAVKEIKSPSGKVLLRNELHAPLLKCANLDKLATGICRDAIALALDRVITAKTEILAALREGKDAASVGETLDLSAIENAITWFEDTSSTLATTSAAEQVRIASELGA